MTGRLQQHALGRLNFTGEVTAAQRLAACKTFLRLETAMIRMRHDAGEPGQAVAKARSAMIDIMLSHLFRYAIESHTRTMGELPSAVSLVALGGYGRERKLSDAEQDALPRLARGAALRILLTRLVDWFNVPPGALVRPKDPLEYVRKLRFLQNVQSIRDYGIAASGMVT